MGVSQVDDLRRAAGSAIAANASTEVASRGEAYARRGKVLSLESSEGSFVRAVVEGSRPDPYNVAVRVVETTIEALCTCPFDTGWCKHIVATIVAACDPSVAQPKRRAPKASRYDTALDTIFETTSRPATPSQRKRRRAFPPLDPTELRRSVRATMRSLSRMRPSQAYWHVGEVTHELDAVREQAEARIATGDYGDGFAQLSILTGEMTKAWEALDDSDGLVGDLAREIAATWMRALLGSGITLELRRSFVDSLAKWDATYSDYGLDEAFGAAIAAARDGWDEDGPPGLVSVKLDLLEGRGDEQHFLDLALHSGEIRRYALLRVRRGEVTEALAAFGAADVSERDVLDVAKALSESGDTESALVFALRFAQQPEALTSGRYGWSAHDGRLSIARWVAETAETCGDAATALAAAERRYELSVDEHEYRRIERLAGNAWPEYRRRLIERARTAERGECLDAVNVLLEADLLQDAIAVFDAGKTWVGHDAAYKLFVRAAQEAPEWAIRNALPLAQDIIGRSDRPRYATAARWLRVVAFAYRSAGRAAEWQALKEALMEKHRAKRALVPLIAAIP